MALAVTDFISGEIPPKGTYNTKVLLVSGYDSKVSTDIKIEEIANNWYHLVGTTVANDKLYVSDRDGFYEIQQLSKPADLAQNRKLIVKWPDENTWNTSPQWHQFVFTPFFYNGYFYAPYSGCVQPMGPSDANPTTKMAGAFLKWNLGGNLEAFAGGLRSPNGANVDTATGDMFVADNQGAWLPSSTFALMKAGKFYGHRQTPTTKNASGVVTATHPPNWAEGLPYEPPTAWLPHGTVRASPSQPIVIPKGIYAGDWLMGDVNNPGLIRVALDKVGDTYNGAVFFFSKGTKTAAINRLAWGPDGALYLGTIATIAGNWPGGNNQGMFRLVPNMSSTAFEMRSVRSLADGLELEFTLPVDPATVVKTAFTVKQWQYIRQEEYGQGRQPDQALTVSDVEVSVDLLRVHIKITGLIKDRTINIKHTGITSNGKAPWNDETWFTQNAVSTRIWEASVGTREVVANANRSVGNVICRMAQGRLSISVETEGAWNAVLVSPQGSVLGHQSGNGLSNFQMDGDSHTGLHLLRVAMKNGVVIRKVML